jgi:hypothetical protein
MKDLKKFGLFFAFILLYGIAATPIFAGSFSDNFNDGNTEGWNLDYSPYGSGISGNWRVENGELIQDLGGDDYTSLVENVQSSSQIVQTDLKFNNPSGYGGITIWFQGDPNYVNIRLYPAAGELWVDERINSVNNLYRYTNPAFNLTWYTLKVDADSSNGELAISINGTQILTHTVTTTNRTGQTGLHSGNAGGSFDNFSLISESIPDPLVNKVQCKNGGWQLFTNPDFKNQGACIRYIEGL